MRSLLSFTVENFLLFEATLLQYALFATAATSSSNWSSTSTAPLCQGCSIEAPRSLLSFPGDVTEVTTTQAVTVVPYIIIYETGGNVTSYSTYTKYSSGAPSQGLASPPAPLTWEEYGLTLTYPTTYIAYPNISAAVTRTKSGECAATFTSVSLALTEIEQLIFPYGNGTGDNDAVTSSAQSIIDALPTISALVAPNKPSACSHAVGDTTLESATPEKSSSVAAVLHTTVAFLTTSGQAVITRSSGSAPPPPPQSEIQGGGSSGGQNNQQSTAVINWGSSTITEGPGGVWNIGGQPLTAGGAAQVIDGTTISVAKGGSVAVVNGHTTSLASVPASGSGSAATTGGASGQVPIPNVTWFTGLFVGFFGTFIGVYL